MEDAGFAAAAAVPSVVAAEAGTSSQRSGGGRTRELQLAAEEIAAQPLPVSHPRLWGLLTALTDKARNRPQGLHIVLHSSEHVLGRLAKEKSCHFDSIDVSGRHCTIFRKFVDDSGNIIPYNDTPNPGDRVVGYVKDTSSNGTFVNSQKLLKNGEEVRLQHGDIISLVAVPELENALAFVYQEAPELRDGTVPSQPRDPASQSHKRKGPQLGPDRGADDTGEAVGREGKRIRALGCGGVSGPILLSDIHQLQRSNEELRLQLEAHVVDIENMRLDHHSAEERYASELKGIQAARSEKSRTEQEELRTSLVLREKELEAIKASCIEQDNNIEVLKQQLASAAQSQSDAEEVIDSLKERVEVLEKFLQEERAMSSKERAEAQASLKAALDQVHKEAAEELKCHDDAAACEKDQLNKIIHALQDGEREYRSSAEVSRRKLDLERAAVVAAEENMRQLETQLQEETKLNIAAQSTSAKLERKLQQACIELEKEKAANEQAQLQIAGLELEMETAIKDLKLEQQRLQGVRERILLRERQLQAFHSTAAEIAGLQQRQQDQLSAMIRALQDVDSDNDHIDNNKISPTKSHRGLSEFDNQQADPRIQESGCVRAVSGGQLLLNNLDSLSLHKISSCHFVTKDIKIEYKEVIRDTALIESAHGDTQQDGYSNIPSFIRSSDSHLPPAPTLPAVIMEETLCPSAVQNYEGDCDIEGITVAQDRAGSNPGIKAQPITINEELTDEHELETCTLNLLDNRGIQNTGFDEVLRVSVCAKATDRSMMEAISESRRHPRDSLCTADLLASEVAGSWAVGTQASASEDTDSFSGGNPHIDADMHITNDEETEYLVSQVATNYIAGTKQRDGSPACQEGRNPATDMDVNVDMDVDMSQTMPNRKKPIIEPPRLQERQAFNEMLDTVAPAFGHFYEAGRMAKVGGSDADSFDSSGAEDSSSGEEGEIGASEPVFF